MRFLVLLLALCAGAQAQTTVYFRSGLPKGTRIVSPGCTNTTPVTCTVISVAGLSVGDVVGISGVAVSTGLHWGAANGPRKIKAIVGSTVSLTDLSGVDIVGNGSWCPGGLGCSASTAPQTLAKLLPFTLTGAPSGWFDGPNGTYTRKWGLSTDNGLVSLICGSGICTVTTSYDHTCVGSGVGICVTDKVSIWNTSSTTLSPVNTGGEYAVLTSTAFTFTFASSVTGDFTHNDTCGPGANPNQHLIAGTSPCVVISQMAVSTSWPWNAVVSSINSFPPSGGSYRFAFDGGGGLQYSTQVSGYASVYAQVFFVDRKRQDILDAGLYILNNVQKMGGNNFPVNEAVGDGGNYELAAYTNTPYMADFGTAYSLLKEYLTPAQRKTFIDKVLNDITDPTPCTKNIPVPIALLDGSGVAVGGSSTTMTLAAGASSSSGFYTNGEAEVILASGDHTYALVTGYNGATKVVTVASWSNGNPAAGSTYNIWETSSMPDITHLTGYGTHWNTPGAPDEIHVGDYIFTMNAWGGFLSTGRVGFYVTAINSDTNLTGVYGNEARATSTPQTSAISYPWDEAAHDCGWNWVQNYWQGAPGSQPAVYPFEGGVSTDGFGGNNGYPLAAMMFSLYFALAADDDRAITKLAQISPPFMDSGIAFLQGFSTGFTQSGLGYGLGTTTINAHRTAWTIDKSLDGFPAPALDTGGAWIMGLQKMEMYAFKPDKPFISGEHKGMYSYFGRNTSSALFSPGCTVCMAMAINHGIAFNPTDISSKYAKYWLDNVIGLNNVSAVTNSSSLLELAFKIDPRQQTVDYKVQPSQYFFNHVSTAAALTYGYSLPTTWQANGFISRTKGWASTSDTHLMVRMNTYAAIDDDLNQAGDTQLYKAGFLLANAWLFPGETGDNPSDPGYTINTDVTEFGGVNTTQTGYPNTGVVLPMRWGQYNHGAWDPSYGDQDSNFAYGMAELKGMYTNTVTRLQKSWTHAKRPGTGEVLGQYVDIRTPAPIIIRDQLFYPQNGESTAINQNVIYDEGLTTCPGSGGCASLNTNGRVIVEHEDGGVSHGDPARVYNLISSFFSLSSMTLNFDGDAYAFSQGHANRVSVYGGNSVGGTDTALEYVVCHEITVQPNVTPTAVALNPDGNWAGCQTADKILLWARGGNTRTTLTTFTPANNGTTDYHIAGLTEGNSYSVTVNGLSVPGSPFSPAASDNSIFFSALTNGPVVVTSGASTPADLFPLPSAVRR